jgi:hypothetical protein
VQRPGAIPPGTDFVWEQAERRIDAQLRQADALDSKAGILVGIHALAAGLVASMSGGLGDAARWVAIVVLFLLLASGWLAVGAFRAQEYRRSPSPEAIWRFAGWGEREMRLRLLSTRFEGIEWNRRKLQWKARRITWSINLLAVVALMVAIATIVELVQ